MPNVPNIKTKIPGPKSEELINQRNDFVPPGVYLVQPVTICDSEGALVTDVDGNTLLDFTSGIGVTSLGHSKKEILDTISEQAGKLIHSCIHVANYEPYVKLAKKLTEITPGEFKKRTLMLNSGSEAVENAIKIVRQSTGRPNIVSFENSFHGRTYMAMTLTGKWDPYKVGLGPFVPGVFFTPFPYAYRCPWGTDDPEECGKAAIHHIEKSIFKTQVDPSTVGAIITEPVQGEGGFIDPPKNFLPMLKDLCEEHEIQLIIDEVQTGFARTGKMWAIEHFGVEPDVMVMAKAIASGLPLSAVVAKEELTANIYPGSLGGTYGGNPIACATALKVIEIIERDKIVEKSEKMGKYLRTRLDELQSRYEKIGDVRGLGPMLAMEFVKDKSTKKPDPDTSSSIMKECLKNGLMTLKAGLYSNAIRLHPPLTIEEEYLDIGMDILENAIKKFD
ncbi:aminotransferase class III-fold pyridoxal phosphate-dependent enzyme [Candidatus Bathyarchaeota archaeon]|nr:aminotransferase class III-fold pyridoxal phosphate-dependent enzyme [Candidatus Bathyarchaeota archaeon]